MTRRSHVKDQHTSFIIDKIHTRESGFCLQTMGLPHCEPHKETSMCSLSITHSHREEKRAELGTLFNLPRFTNQNSLHAAPMGRSRARGRNWQGNGPSMWESAPGMEKACSLPAALFALSHTAWTPTNIVPCFPHVWLLFMLQDLGQIWPPLKPSMNSQGVCASPVCSHVSFTAFTLVRLMSTTLPLFLKGNMPFNLVFPEPNALTGAQYALDKCLGLSFKQASSFDKWPLKPPFCVLMALVAKKSKTWS